MQFRSGLATVLVAAAFLGLAVDIRSAEPEPIVRVEGQPITRQNEVGCKLVIQDHDGGFALGKFYVDYMALTQ
jgi:hypothetical protein